MFQAGGGVLQPGGEYGPDDGGRGEDGRGLCAGCHRPASSSDTQPEGGLEGQIIDSVDKRTTKVQRT